MKSGSPSSGIPRRSVPVTFVDANILFSRVLRDYFLYSAHMGALELRWSQEVLDEMSRNLRTSIGLDEFSTRRLEELMNEFLPDAKLKSPVDRLVVPHDVEVHPKDRHVLAAALSTDADILLTDNTKDFPAEWMTRKGIELVHPSAMITRLLTDFPSEFREAHFLCVDLSTSEDEETVLNQLEKTTDPFTAAKVRRFVRP